MAMACPNTRTDGFSMKCHRATDTTSTRFKCFVHRLILCLNCLFGVSLSSIKSGVISTHLTNKENDKQKVKLVTKYKMNKIVKDYKKLS
ncbi:hypothetical protein VIBNISOn1_970111 [Vibrio nigripulchritudo SOn1]|uniref:Uncharacterized protein n=1 Tax=Vibrio nigripulchritudo SOn1 TaxID=1238450 RepID=A0AAV2VZQ2_9VIBR|nr:hypothetical protein VIBNISFn118_1030038 [Vibrio nigripulchritudo SFn118]CCO50088.1 hypothetical protein VIBNISOn1_970111 [Vibrio nigripulchritudo SOn1]